MHITKILFSSKTEYAGCSSLPGWYGASQTQAKPRNNVTCLDPVLEKGNLTRPRGGDLDIASEDEC